MKKLSILFLGALALFATSCEDDLEPAKPQQNPQGPVLKDGGIVSEAYGALSTTDTELKLAEYSEIEATVPVMKLAEVTDLDESAKVVYKVELSASDDFSKSVTLVAAPGTTEETKDIYYLNASEWNNAQIQLHGKTEAAMKTFFRVPVFVELDGSEYRYQATDYYAATGDIMISRMPFEYVVENNYYVFGPFVAGNDPAKGDAMKHNELNDVYDDPVFNYYFEVTEEQAAAGYTLMIVPESLRKAGTKPAQCFGAGAGEGEVIVNGTPIAITAAGPWKLEFNAEEMTYSVSIAPKTLFVVTTGAAFTSDKCLQLPTTDFINYNGVGYLDTHFRLTGQKAWKPLCYGPAEGSTLTFDEESGWWNGDLALNDNWVEFEGNKAKFKGLNYMEVNIIKLSYNIYHIEKLGIVGEVNNWGNENPDKTVTPDVELKATDKYKNTWKGEVDVKAAGEWKIRANSDWKVDFGGVAEGQTQGEISKGGKNLKFAEPGKYEVEVNFKTLPYTVTVTKK